MTTPQLEPTAIPAPFIPTCWCCGRLIVMEAEVHHFSASYLAEMQEQDLANEWGQMVPGTYYSHARLAECLVGLAWDMARGT